MYEYLSDKFISPLQFSLSFIKDLDLIRSAFNSLDKLDLILKMLILQLTIFLIALILVFYFKFKLKKKDLRGKTALVTGGSNGLGQQICLKLAQQGCNVIIVDISSATETLFKLEPYNIKSKAFKVDVSNYQEIINLREILTTEFGLIDIIVNNAGLIPYKSIFEQTSDEIETLNKVNLNSVIFVSKYICTVKSIKFICFII